MSELDTLRTFYRLHSRVRRNYLEAILALPPGERTKDRGASYPSLEAIYVHVLDGQVFWFELVPQDRIEDAARRERAGRPTDPAALRSMTDEADRRIEAFLGPLAPEDLAREIICHFPGPTGPTEVRFLVGDILWHMVEEEFQHRGELNALLWQMDVAPPIASFSVWNDAKVPGMYR